MGSDGTPRKEGKPRARQREKRTASVQGEDQLVTATEAASVRSLVHGKRIKRLYRSLQVASDSRVLFGLLEGAELLFA